jgi:hypothetical protein
MDAFEAAIGFAGLQNLLSAVAGPMSDTPLLVNNYFGMPPRGVSDGEALPLGVINF